MSRSRVNESSEWNFIKVILTKDQGRNKENKEWMRIGKSRGIKSRWDLLLHRKVWCGPQSVQSPGGHSLFFWEFLRSSCQSISSYWSTIALGSDCGLLLRTEVQLVVFYTTIEVQVVFKMLFVLVTGQLAIAGQLGRMEDRDSLEEEVLVDETARDGFILFWKTTARPEIEAFPYFQEWDLRASFFAYLVQWCLWLCSQ